MSEFLKVRNWDKWQTYRSDRGRPTWIKLHRCILTNAEWATLTDAQRGQLVTMWVLAADREGVIPSSPDILKKICGMDSEPDLELFISLGFIESDAVSVPSWQPNGNQVVTNCQPSGGLRVEKRREEKRREDKEGGRARTRDPLPPGDKRLKMLDDIAAERGSTVAAAVKALGLDGIAGVNVSRLKQWLKALPDADPAKAAAAAKAAERRPLLDACRAMYDGDGPEAAREYARGQDVGVRVCLLAQVQTWENSVDH